LRLYEPESAHKILLEPRGDLNDRDKSIVMAEYHALVGEYSEAIAIARKLFEADASDVQAAILLGDVYHDSSQFQLAAAAYSASLARCGQHDQEQRRDILRLLAKNDLLAWQLDRAIAILNGLVEENPSDVASRLLLMEALAEA